MGMLTKVGSFAISTAAAGNTQVISGVGFAPKFVKFWWSGRTEATNTIGNATHRRGVGVAVNGSFGVSYPSYCVNSRSENGALSAQTASDTNENSCIAVLAVATDTGEGGANVTTWGSDGFTLTIQQAFLSGFRIFYCAYGGDDITNIETLITTEPLNPGTVNMIFGFEPEYLFQISNPSGAVTVGPAPDSRMNIGAASFRDGAIQQWVCSMGSNDGAATMDTEEYNNEGEFIAHINTAFNGTLTGRANISARSGGTVTLNWSTTVAVGNREHIVLAVRGGNWRVGRFDTVAATNDITVSNLGFQPNGLLICSTARTEDSGDTTAGTDEWVMGAADMAGAEINQTIEDQNGALVAVVVTALEYDSIYATTDGDITPAIDARITFTEYQAGGFELNQPVSDGAGREVYYVATGSRLNPGRTLIPFI